MVAPSGLGPRGAAAGARARSAVVSTAPDSQSTQGWPSRPCRCDNSNASPLESLPRLFFMGSINRRRPVGSSVIFHDDESRSRGHNQRHLVECA